MLFEVGQGIKSWHGMSNLKRTRGGVVVTSGGGSQTGKCKPGSPSSSGSNSGADLATHHLVLWLALVAEWQPLAARSSRVL